MIHASLQLAIATIPSGNWLAAVSGGADSTALFHLLRTRSDLTLIVAHLNHQLRGPESDTDESFVRSLHPDARIARRETLESQLRDLSANPSARFRALRFAHFKQIVDSEHLQGVILAHHADDQAETVLQRLLRGAGYSALAGMSRCATVNGVRVLRPLLDVRRDTLRTFLTDRNLFWREDMSNTSPKYLRNRLRAILRDRPELTEALLKVSRVCASLKSWTKQTAPKLDHEFRINYLDDLPAILARRSAGEWLRNHNVPADLIDRAVVDRLRTMCADAGSASRQQFPGGVFVRRRGGGIISAE